MPGSLGSAGSGPLTWMLSNATLIEWIGSNGYNANQEHNNENENQADDAAQTANVT